jgi:hypothetical protein
MTQHLHYKNPKKELAHVAIFYRNFLKGKPNFCHVGLGVNGIHTCKVLRKHGITCDLFGVWTADHIREQLNKNESITHALIEAPWVSVIDTAKLCDEFPRVHFLVRSHSQIGFLQVEPGAIQIIRGLLLLQESTLNLTVAANSQKLAKFIERTYTGHCLFLPNLYDANRVHRKRDTDFGNYRKLRISSFGALRLMKNHCTSAAAALVIAESRRADLEFWVNVNREEHGKGVLQSLRNMFEGLPWAKLVESPWQQWGDFRVTAAHMDLALQNSYSETFNISSADSVSGGVPVVTSSAIEWVPTSWHADCDSVEDIARVGNMLLSNHHAAEEGLQHLLKYLADAERRWLAYLDSNPGEHHHFRELKQKARSPFTRERAFCLWLIGFEDIQEETIKSLVFLKLFHVVSSLLSHIVFFVPEEFTFSRHLTEIRQVVKMVRVMPHLRDSIIAKPNHVFS